MPVRSDERDRRDGGDERPYGAALPWQLAPPSVDDGGDETPPDRGAAVKSCWSEIDLAHVLTSLQKPLPGLRAQMDMSPAPRGEPAVGPSVGPNPRLAGVLLLLYPGDLGLRLVLTRRSQFLTNHRGQISFPGGTMEPGESPAETATREAFEELGIDLARAQILGQLTPLDIPRTNFRLYPVVAYATEPPLFVANPTEVTEVIEVYLCHLLDAGNRRLERLDLHGVPTDVPFFACGPHRVWGATAMVLAEFLALLK